MEVLMNNNEIKNEFVAVPDGKSLNDRDYLNSILSTLKEMEKNYSIAMSEASNEFLYQEYKRDFDMYILLQRKVFELMFKNGWYVLECADANKISKKYLTLSNEFNSLSK